MTLGYHQILCTTLLVVGAALFIGLERRFPYNRGQRLLREQWGSDLFLYGIVQSYLLGVLISLLLEWLDTYVPRISWVSPWPWAVQFVFFLVTHDVYIYWFHRLQHSNRILWRLHEAHHSTTTVDWLSGSRSHALEILVNQSIEFMPIVLLGASPDIILYKALIDGVWGMYIHSNIDVRSGRLQWILNGPEMHRWHHACNRPEAYNKNFSTKLAIWDWMFGTAHRPSEKATEYGLTDRFPQGYFRQQAYAFRGMNDSASPKKGTGSCIGSS